MNNNFVTIVKKTNYKFEARLLVPNPPYFSQVIMAQCVPLSRSRGLEIKHLNILSIPKCKDLLFMENN